MILLLKYLFSYLVVLLCLAVSHAQKRVIDKGMLYAWPIVSGSLLSSDGSYIAYTIFNQPIGSQTLVVQATKYPWRKEVVGKHQILFFGADCQRLYWARNDSVFVQQSGTDSMYLVNAFARWSYPRESKGEWIGGWEKKGGFLLRNLISDKMIRIDSITDYFFEPGGNVLLLFGKHVLQWLNLHDQQAHVIWEIPPGQRPFDYRFNTEANQLAFIANEQVWYYESGLDKARLLVEKPNSLLQGSRLSYLSSFSENGHWLFVDLERPVAIKPVDSSKPKVAIWSYRDEVLYPANDFVQSTSVTVAVGIHDQIIRVVRNDSLMWMSERVPHEQVVVEHSQLLCDKIDGANWWPYAKKPSYWLLDLPSGQQKLLRPGKQQPASHFHFSPNGQWVVYWDEALASFISYDVATNLSCNLTGQLPVSFKNEAIERSPAGPVGIAGWMSNNDLLVYDNYDLWRLDPSGKRNPVYLTGGYGHKHQIKLRLVYDKPPDLAVYQEHDSLLLTGLQIQTMYNGFFRLRLNQPRELELLTMGPYTYYQVRSQQGHPNNFSTGMQPLQGGTSDHPCWVVIRQSVTEYPNLYFTEDLKSFRPLTNFKPQKDYNWLTAELIHWTMLNGQPSQGVLYKPKNFDPHKKYPVIFNYYEKVSHRVHQFPQPGLTMDNINIPWFVSRGYLVFTPDIHYTMASRKGGMTVGEAACNAVVSAAKHLAKLPYVDSKRMGLQGHSFGAMQTAYIVTHSKLFAAAAEMAGTTDHLSSYLSLVGGQDGQAVESEAKQDHPQARMGATPWERPDLYRRNSAVLNADKTTTPLLITHNRKDGSVDFRQGVALYLALRRLGKPCWLLQYANSGHSLNPDDGLDYTVRLTQFFDHYLKGTAAPEWLK
jgi:dienelactone hydrolase